MLSSDNDDSNQESTGKKKRESPSKQTSENNSNKIKILSQTLLKAANLTTRKDFLNQVLESSESKFNKIQRKQVVIDDESPSATAKKVNDAFILNII